MCSLSRRKPELNPSTSATGHLRPASGRRPCSQSAPPIRSVHYSTLYCVPVCGYGIFYRPLLRLRLCGRKEEKKESPRTQWTFWVLPNMVSVMTYRPTMFARMARVYTSAHGGSEQKCDSHCGADDFRLKSCQTQSFIFTNFERDAACCNLHKIIVYP